MPKRTHRTAAVIDGFLYGAGSVGDLAGARLPPAGPIRPSGGFAADAAAFRRDAHKLAGDGRRAVRKVIPADVLARVHADA